MRRYALLLVPSVFIFMIGLNDDACMITGRLWSVGGDYLGSRMMVWRH